MKKEVCVFEVKPELPLQFVFATVPVFALTSANLIKMLAKTFLLKVLPFFGNLSFKYKK